MKVKGQIQLMNMVLTCIIIVKLLYVFINMVNIHMREFVALPAKFLKTIATCSMPQVPRLH